MQLKTFPYTNFAVDNPEQTMLSGLRELYMQRVVALDSVSISMREDESCIYVDSSTVGEALLHNKVIGTSGKGSDLYRIHEQIYEQFADIGAVVTGRSPYTFSLLKAGISLGEPTSMMKKRNTINPDSHILPAESLEEHLLDASLATARDKSDSENMPYMLLIVRNNMMICCAPNLHEALVHFQNIEFAAKLKMNQVLRKAK